MKCTQYGFCEQGAFKNARAILFFIHIYIIYFGGGGGSQAGQATIYGSGSRNLCPRVPNCRPWP